MKKKTVQLGELVCTGHLDKYEAWSSLTLMAMKSLEYPLPALTLTEDECTQIMWPLLKGYLPKTGVNCHFPRNILYGSPEEQGLGLKNLYVSQGVAHVVDIIQHTWYNSLTGKLIRQSLEHLRMELGINGNIFNLDFTKHKGLILNNSWIQHTWKFMSEFKIQLQIETADIKLRQTGDKCIMEEVLNKNVLSNNELRWFN